MLLLNLLDDAKHYPLALLDPPAEVDWSYSRDGKEYAQVRKHPFQYLSLPTEIEPMREVPNLISWDRVQRLKRTLPD